MKNAGSAKCLCVNCCPYLRDIIRAGIRQRGDARGTLSVTEEGNDLDHCTSPCGQCKAHPGKEDNVSLRSHRDRASMAKTGILIGTSQGQPRETQLGRSPIKGDFYAGYRMSDAICPFDCLLALQGQRIASSKQLIGSWTSKVNPHFEPTFLRLRRIK
jgi:hypothetical protein